MVYIIMNEWPEYIYTHALCGHDVHGVVAVCADDFFLNIKYN